MDKHRVIRKKPGIFRSVISAIAAFLFYGSWAYYANSMHAQPIVFKAAITQGTYAFVSTLILSLFIEFLFKIKKNISFFLVFCVTCMFLYSTSYGINFLLGTPEIFVTILPGMVIGTVYAFFYIFGLSKSRSNEMHG